MRETVPLSPTTVPTSVLASPAPSLEQSTDAVPSGTPLSTPQPTQEPTTPPAAETGFQIAFIDVGQGDATLITIGAERLLIDSGRRASTIRIRLEALGVDDLDGILATHPDADHIGGFAEVLSMFDVERIYVNGGSSGSLTYANFMAAVNNESAQVETLARGQNIPLGGLLLSVLHPDGLTGDSNNDSLVLNLTCGAVDVLLTGDVEIAGERSMLAAEVLQDVAVLKVGHHGSTSSTSQAFLGVVSPEFAIISAGLGNSYGHPHPEVVTRLGAAGVQLLYTDIGPGDDTVVMTSDCKTFSFDAKPAVGTGTPPASPTAAATPPTTSAGNCGGATGTITGLDKVAEIVTVNAQGPMSGWYVISTRGSQRYDFPYDFVGAGVVQIWSGAAQFPDSPGQLWWTSANVWNNSSNDDAELHDCNGAVVDTFDDGR